MKHTIVTMLIAIRDTWRNKPMLRRLVFLSVPVLLIGFALGGIRTAMLLTGYLQLVFRAVLPGEPVENSAVQRMAALCGGLVRMLFFTGMMIHAVWPFVLMAVVQVFGLLILRIGEWSGMEISLLPVLAAAGFVLLGILFGMQDTMAFVALYLALFITMIDLAYHGKQNLHQLRMRFHLI